MDSDQAANGIASICHSLDQMHSGIVDVFSVYGGHGYIRRIELRDMSSSTEGEGISFSESVDYGDHSDFSLWDHHLPVCLHEGSSSERLQLCLIPVLFRRTKDLADRAADTRLLRALFDAFKLPSAALALFFQNKVQVTRFPTVLEQQHDIERYVLTCRQWALTWSRCQQTGSTRGILLYTEESWASVIAGWAGDFLRSLKEFHSYPTFLAVVGGMVATKHISEDLNRLDREAYRRERDLRLNLSTGLAVTTLDLGDMSAETSWLAARAARHRNRLFVVGLMLEETNSVPKSSTSAQISLASEVNISSQTDAIGTVEGLSTPFKPPRASQEGLHLILEESLIGHLKYSIKCLDAHSLKLSEEATVQLSALYNLIAQRDQKTNIEIAQASHEIAAESRKDQKISVDIAEATAEIAAESKKGQHFHEDNCSSNNDILTWHFRGILLLNASLQLVSVCCQRCQSPHLDLLHHYSNLDDSHHRGLVAMASETCP
jgi:hypothetical protein